MQYPKNMLEKFQQRPAMFTGEHTLNSIRLFLDGYSFAITSHGMSCADDPLLLPRDFHDWVAYRLHFYEPTSGWCNMIYERYDTEQGGIDRFFELLAEIKTRQRHVVAKLIDYQKTYTHSECHHENGQLVEGPLVTRFYPHSISLVTYTSDPGFFAYSDTNDEFPSEGFFPNLKAFEVETGANRSQLTIVDDAWPPPDSTTGER